MTLPNPQPRPDPVPGLPRAAGASYAKLYRHGLMDDPTLTGSEKLLLACLLNLQAMRGGGWFRATYAEIGRELCRDPDHARRLLRRLNATHEAGGTQWKVCREMRRYRGDRNCPNLFKVRVPPETAAAWRERGGVGGAAPGASGGGWGAQAPGSGGRERPGGGGRKRPPIKKDLKEVLKNAAPAAADAAPLFEERGEPDEVGAMALAGTHPGGLAAGIADGFKREQVLYVLWEGAWRLMQEVRPTPAGLAIVLADEATGDEAETVQIRGLQLGGVRFGR